MKLTTGKSAAKKKSASGGVGSKSNFVVRMLLDHYGNTEYIRTDDQVKADERILGGLVKFSRYYILPAAVLVQFCSGSLYAWSVLNKPVDNLLFDNENANRASATFYIAIGFFGFGAAIFGPWIERNSPRRCSTVGTMLFAIGNMLAALALQYRQLWLLYVGYGMVTACGIGINYVTTTSIVQKWYPNSRGLAAGFAVCGFGGGALAFTKVRIMLYRSTSLPIMFVIEGALFFIIMFSSAQVFRAPPPGYYVNGLTLQEDSKGRVQRAFAPTDDVEKQANIKEGHHLSGSAMNGHNNNLMGGKSFASGMGDDSEFSHSPQSGTAAVMEEKPTIKITLIQALQSRDLWMLYYLFFANLVFGLVIISRLSPMVQDLFYSRNDDNFVPKNERADRAANIVMIDGMFNIAGRLILSTVSDYIGRKPTFMIMLCAQIIMIVCLPIAMHNGCYWAFLLTSWGATFFYGGGTGVMPAFIADMFGPGNVSACHGIIITAWSIGGIAGGFTFNAIYNSMMAHGYSVSDPYPYTVNLYWILAIKCVGIIILVLLRSKLRDRLFPAVPGQVLRTRLFGRMVRVIRKSKWRFKVEILSHEQEEVEWDDYLMMCIIKLRLVKTDAEVSSHSAAAGGNGPGKHDSMYNPNMSSPSNTSSFYQSFSTTMGPSGGVITPSGNHIGQSHQQQQRSTTGNGSAGTTTPGSNSANRNFRPVSMNIGQMIGGYNRPYENSFPPGQQSQQQQQQYTMPRNGSNSSGGAVSNDASVLGAGMRRNGSREVLSDYQYNPPPRPMRQQSESHGNKVGPVGQQQLATSGGSTSKSSYVPFSQRI